MLQRGNPRVLYLQALSLGVVRLTALSSSLIILSIASRALNESDFAYFAVGTGAFAALGLFDFGLTYATQYECSGAPAEARWMMYRLARRIMMRLALMLAVPGMIAASLAPHPVLTSVGVLLGLSALPLSLADRWRLQCQQAGISALYSGIAALLAIGITLVSIRVGLGPGLVLVTISSYVLVQGIHMARLEIRNRRLRQATDQAAAKSLRRRLFRRSLQFFIPQVNAALVFQADVFFVGALLPAVVVGQFAIAARLVTAGGAVLGAMTAAIYPHMENAAAGLRLREVRRVALALIAAATVLLTVSLLGAYNVFTPGLLILFGAAAPPSGLIAASFGFLAIFTIVNGTGYLASSFKLVRIQTVTAASSICAKLILTPTVILLTGSITALMWASAGAMAVSSLLPLVLVVQRHVQFLAHSANYGGDLQ